MSFKKKIKKLLPKRIIYLYLILGKLPKYIKSFFTPSKKILIRMMSNEEMIEQIITKRMSLSRFGDGELMWMNGEKLNSFQEYSDKFSLDLVKAFKTKNENLLIGLPIGIIDSRGCNVYAKMHWRIVRNGFVNRLSKFIDDSRVYCNASITRPYIDYKDKNYSIKCFNLLKKIWNQRDVVIVEGSMTKLGMGNDLFDGCKRIRRIICPPSNAYEKIEQIIESIKKHVSFDELVLCALGPTASIIASQLCSEGYQIIDIGHVDIEYLWFKMGAIIREPIEGKYVNESGEKNCSNIYDNDSVYLESIIDVIRG